MWYAPLLAAEGLLRHLALRSLRPWAPGLVVVVGILGVICAAARRPNGPSPSWPLLLLAALDTAAQACTLLGSGHSFAASLFGPLVLAPAVALLHSPSLVRALGTLLAVAGAGLTVARTEGAALLLSGAVLHTLVVLNQRRVLQSVYQHPATVAFYTSSVHIITGLALVPLEQLFLGSHESFEATMVGTFQCLGFSCTADATYGLSYLAVLALFSLVPHRHPLALPIGMAAATVVAFSLSPPDPLPATGAVLWLLGAALAMHEPPLRSNGEVDWRAMEQKQFHRH